MKKINLITFLFFAVQILIADEYLIQQLEKSKKSRTKILSILGHVKVEDALLPYLKKVLDSNEIKNHHRVFRIIRNKKNDRLSWKKFFLHLVKNKKYPSDLRCDLLESICWNNGEVTFLFEELIKICQSDFDKEIKIIATYALGSFVSERLSPKQHKKLAKFAYEQIITCKNKHLQYGYTHCLLKLGMYGWEKPYISQILEKAKYDPELIHCSLIITGKPSRENFKYYEKSIQSLDDAFVIESLYIISRINKDSYDEDLCYLLEKMLSEPRSKKVKKLAVKTLFNIGARSGEIITKYYEYEFLREDILNGISKSCSVPNTFISVLIKNLKSNDKAIHESSISALSCLTKIEKQTVLAIKEYTKREDFNKRKTFFCLRMYLRNTSDPNLKTEINKILQSIENK